MSATGGAAADAVILPGYRHPGKKTGHKISECQIRKKKMADKEKSREKADDKEKSSEKADEKADKKADNKETALVTSTSTPNASASVPEKVRPDSNDDILLSSQTQRKIDTSATAHMCNDLDKYYEFIPNYEAMVTVGDNIPLEEIGKNFFFFFYIQLTPHSPTGMAGSSPRLTNTCAPTTTGASTKVRNKRLA